MRKWNISEPKIPIWYSDMRNPEEFKDKFKTIQDKVGLIRVVNSHRITFWTSNYEQKQKHCMEREPQWLPHPFNKNMQGDHPEVNLAWTSFISRGKIPKKKSPAQVSSEVNTKASKADFTLWDPSFWKVCKRAQTVRADLGNSGRSVYTGRLTHLIL